MKKFVYMILAICFCQFMAFQVKAANRSTGSWDSGHSIATDIYGNVYVAGDFNSSTITFGMITLPGGYFTVKYSPDGNLLWAKNANG